MSSEDPGMMEGDHGKLEASCEDIFEIDIILIDGAKKPNYSILLDNSVSEEKKRIWETEAPHSPNWQELTLVILKQNGEQIPMDDNRTVISYTADLAGSQIKFMHNGHASYAEAQQVDLAAVNIKMKEH